MTSSGSLCTITFKKPKTAPPLFLAGSFTESNWEPQEMDSRLDEDGEYTFTKNINIIPGHEYQYRFKSGELGPWILDESQAIVTDENGQRSNLLKTPLPDSGEKSSITLPVRFEARSSTPAEIVAKTAAEVADTAEQLDKNVGNPTSDYTWTKEEPLRMPLFAHESFGPYEFLADDALDHDQVDNASSPRQPRKESMDYSVEEVDINDPTIVSFPSDRSSVMSTLRKIQSSVDGNTKIIEASSPGDDFALTSGSLTPKSPGSSEKREGRLSHGSYGNKRSTASLTSIAEEDPRPIQSSSSGKPRTPQPTPGEVFEFSRTPPSDDDHGMVMKQKKKTTNCLISPA